MSEGELIFLSYSRGDAWLVRKFALLMRALGLRPWRDTRSIEPGAAWRVEITRAIADCDRMLVFVCAHSKSSEEVRNEYQEALQRRKVVVPVMLDRTPIPIALSHLQAVDLRALGALTHAVLRVARVTICAGLGSLIVWWVF